MTSPWLTRTPPVPPHVAGSQCSALHRAFPCDAGCAMVLGPDVPNFVADARNVEHYGQCLFTEKESLCAAKQWSTARLCPCAPS